jgi:hypothetical protein
VDTIRESSWEYTNGVAILPLETIQSGMTHELSSCKTAGPRRSLDQILIFRNPPFTIENGIVLLHREESDAG